MPKTEKRVLLVLGWYDFRLQRGIERYAQQHHWHLSPGVAREKVIPWGWRGDGILAWLGHGDDLAEFVLAAKVPTVDFSIRRPHLKFARVLTDNARLSQLVAEHFLSRGFKNFLFYSDTDNWTFEERGAGFVERLKRAGRECVWLRWHRSPAYYPAGRYQEWEKKRKWLGAELKKAPKPLAVFAPTDWMAFDLLETCESSGLAVPNQIAIVGSDNSLLAVETMQTPISTVEPNLEAMGYRGAALLDELMDGKPAPKEPIRMPPSGLIVRKTSDVIAAAHPGVSRSVRYLLKHYQEPIGVNDLAKAAGMSIRGFHQAFLEHIGWPPGHELHRIRIEHAKQLLASSSEKAQAIAAMCGYRNVNTFLIAFRKDTGISPRQYRRQFCCINPNAVF